MMEEVQHVKSCASKVNRARSKAEKSLEKKARRMACCTSKSQAYNAN
jgi:hypothetical protein